MDKKLTNKLYKKYPKLLCKIAFECGDGWEWLLHNLCDLLQFDIDRNNHRQIHFTQIKEKFGTLRAYYEYTEAFVAEELEGDYIQNLSRVGEQAGMVKLAELMSASICEECGSTNKAKLYTFKGWKYTRCPSCYELLTKR